jgi:hypothetical protein
MEPSLEYLPSEILGEIISLYPKRSWFLLNKRFLKLAVSIIDPSIDDNFALRCAARQGFLEVIQRLLQDPRVDPSADDNHAIIVASMHGHVAVVERLLQDPRVNAGAFSNMAIRMATQRGHLEVIKVLLKNERVNPNAGMLVHVLEIQYFTVGSGSTAYSKSIKSQWTCYHNSHRSIK